MQAMQTDWWDFRESKRTLIFGALVSGEDDNFGQKLLSDDEGSMSDLSCKVYWAQY